MSVAEIIIAILGSLGVGSLLPTVLKGAFDFWTGKHQGGVSLLLAKNQGEQNEKAELRKQVDYILEKWIEAKEEITQINIDKFKAEYELAESNKKIVELTTELAARKFVKEAIEALENEG